MIPDTLQTFVKALSCSRSLNQIKTILQRFEDEGGPYLIIITFKVDSLISGLEDPGVTGFLLDFQNNGFNMDANSFPFLTQRSGVYFSLRLKLGWPRNLTGPTKCGEGTLCNC